MAKEIISDPEILSGTPVFAGTRIPLEQVAALIRRGRPEAELAEHFPGLDTEDFAFARSYAREHAAPQNILRPLEFRRKSKVA
jgi:uncharacterized protein (DUF433 family)